MSSQFIKISFLLTGHTSKIRVKRRKDIFFQGLPVDTRQYPIDKDCYLEWQISYDLKKTNSNFENLYPEIINKIEIKNEKGEPTERFIYDLSDYLIEIIKQKFVSLTDIKNLLKEIKTETKFLTDELEIYRTHPKEYHFSQFTFLKSTVSYPLLIYEISGLLIKIEIIVKEKQKAIGIQPMLFLCIPIKLMEDFEKLENQIVNAKQKTNYLVDKNNFQFITETIKIFAILSEKHHQDIINILQTILTDENI
jgi:hypothetical protein